MQLLSVNSFFQFAASSTMVMITGSQKYYVTFDKVFLRINHKLKQFNITTSSFVLFPAYAKSSLDMKRFAIAAKSCRRFIKKRQSTLESLAWKLLKKLHKIIVVIQICDVDLKPNAREFISSQIHFSLIVLFLWLTLDLKNTLTLQ